MSDTPIPRTLNLRWSFGNKVLTSREQELLDLYEKLERELAAMTARATEAERDIKLARDVGKTCSEVADIFKARAESAEKACAEMRGALLTAKNHFGRELSAFEADSLYRVVDASLESPAGRDYVHKSELTAKQIEALEWALKMYCDDHVDIPSDEFNNAITRLRNGGTLES